MCEGVTICPGTGDSIENAPCKVALDFFPETRKVLDGIWDEIERTMVLEDAAKEGMTGYQMLEISNVR